MSDTRSMKIEIDGTLLYESFFDPKTGNLVRRTAQTEIRERQGDWVSHRRGIPHKIEEKLRKRFSHRWDCIPSPSPELVDISITDKCGFGCTYCYQDSTPDKKHAPKDLVAKVIKGFEHPPYQIAIGGGEPTSHPDFPEILREAKGLGTVPNYTTAGHVFRPEVIEATNQVSGGVALTFHSFKGLDWFEQTYRRWRRALKCQLNVHLIADKAVAENLYALVGLQQKLKEKLNLVLLAYYPDVGRASMEHIMTRRVYTQDLPETVALARAKGMNIAFSEGLLPFFLSRPEMGVNTKYAARAEGVFSCYVDPRGHMWTSSFDAQDPHEKQKSIYKASSQKLWEELRSGGDPHGEPCYDCEFRAQCSTPHTFHYLTCAFASHNKLPIQITRKSRYDRLNEDD